MNSIDLEIITVIGMHLMEKSKGKTELSMLVQEELEEQICKTLYKHNSSVEKLQVFGIFFLTKRGKEGKRRIVDRLIS